MSRTLSSTALASMMDPETDEVWLVLLTLEHADLATPLRFVNNTEDVVSRGQTFIAFPFEVELPGQDAESPGEARLSIDNVDRQVVLALRELATPLEATFEVILASDPDTVEIEVPKMTLRDVDWDASKVNGTLRFEDVLSEPISLQMTPARFPGLF